VSEQDEQFWILTLCGDTPRGSVSYTRGGTVTPQQEGTHEGVFQNVFRAVSDAFRRETGATEDPSVTFWSLVPNAINGVSR
jgi:hypothetical protein